MCELFQSASCGKNTTSGRWLARMRAITSTDACQAAGSALRLAALTFSSPPGIVSTSSKPR